MRNARSRLVTLIAITLGSIVAGAIVVEDDVLVSGARLGPYHAINQRDYPVLQGIFLILTLSVILANFIADLVYARLDPRVTDVSELHPAVDAAGDRASRAAARRPCAASRSVSPVA